MSGFLYIRPLPCRRPRQRLITTTVSALTRAAAREYIDAGVRINAISPGPIDTPMSLRPGETEADRAERLKTALPAGRPGTVSEAAAAVLWLASPEAGFTVGHDLVIDGGATA